MAKDQIKTSIKINATPEKVWQIRTDFQAYPKWNPSITLVEGKLEEGAQLNVTSGGINFKPILLVCKVNQELRWKGKFIFNGVFDGEQMFEIVDHKDGTISFLNEENFNGILVGFFAKKLETETKPDFEAMNRKLKELAEA